MVELSDSRLEQETSAEPNPAMVMTQQESQNETLQALGDLPTNQQEVILLKFQEGLSYKEISQVTNRTVSNVGYLIHMGMKALREQLEPDVATN